MNDVALVPMHFAVTDRVKLRQLAANTIRALAMDGVQKANSGHPGMPMGMADVGVVLWTQFLKHNPANPAWPDRDRFVLSAGHGSMLLYRSLCLIAPVTLQPRTHRAAHTFWRTPQTRKWS